MEANIRDENIYVVVARPTTEHVTFNNDLVEYDSRIDSDVTLSSPIGSRVKTDNVSVKFTVRIVQYLVVAHLILKCKTGKLLYCLYFYLSLIFIVVLYA